jgi:hypothetical protein
MFIFVEQTLQKKWNEICMKQLASGKHMENNCFPRTLKFEMEVPGLSPIGGERWCIISLAMRVGGLEVV